MAHTQSIRLIQARRNPKLPPKRALWAQGKFALAGFALVALLAFLVYALPDIAALVRSGDPEVDMAVTLSPIFLLVLLGAFSLVMRPVQPPRHRKR